AGAALAPHTPRTGKPRGFRGMGNLQAQAALYGCIMQRAKDFDLFIKLDADMAFASEDTLARVIDEFRARPTMDHFIVDCNDYMTGEQILGVHTFSGRVKWESNGRGIFNDPSPKRPGSRTIVRKPETPYFTHAANPSSLQAFHFGAHRALKLVQRGFGVEDKRVEAMKSQWQALNGVWNQFLRHGDRRHALALVAADLIISGTLGDDAHDYHDAQLLSASETYALQPGSELAAIIRPHWETPEARKAYFERSVGNAGLEKLRQAGVDVEQV
ncbi:MAG: hypothetical protein JJT81_18645, partial [Rubellimicrobium sp.]|nr:hypothetical protein [Rubellimicrobium sp.]